MFGSREWILGMLGIQQAPLFSLTYILFSLRQSQPANPLLIGLCMDTSGKHKPYG